jgi:hypothetical protein
VLSTATTTSVVLVIQSVVEEGLSVETGYGADDVVVEAVDVVAGAAACRVELDVNGDVAAGFAGVVTGIAACVVVVDIDDVVEGGGVTGLADSAVAAGIIAGIDLDDVAAVTGRGTVTSTLVSVEGACNAAGGSAMGCARSTPTSRQSRQ